MSRVDFISKNQFKAVHNHFRELIDKADCELNLNDLKIEFRLLLEYFHSAYKESERKTHKIIHLMTKMSKDKEKVIEIQNRKDADSEQLAIQVSETKDNLESHIKQEKILVKQISELKESIERLKALEKNLKSESDDFLDKYKYPTQHNFRSYRDIGVITEELSKNVKPTRQECEICSKRNSTTNNLTRTNVESIEKYEKLIEKLIKKMQIMSTGLKLSRKEIDNIKQRVQNSSKQLNVLKQQVDMKKAYEEEFKGVTLNQKIFLQTTINNLQNELELKNCELQRLQEDLENTTDEKNTALIENQAKDTVLEVLRGKINSIEESKNISSRKAEMFEEHLATDQERFLSVKNEFDSLTEKVQILKEELQVYETQKDMQERKKKLLKASENFKLMEDKKNFEYCKSQLEVRDTRRDKKLRAVTMEMCGTRRQLANLRKQLKEKVKANTTLALELSKVKNMLNEQNENLRNLKVQFEAVENWTVQLQAKIKSAKSRNEIVLKAKNDLHVQYKELSARYEYQEMKNRLLNKQQEFQRKALKIKDSQIDKLSKKKKHLRNRY